RARCLFFFSSRRRHTRFSRDWSSDVCSSDLGRRAGDPATGAGCMSVKIAPSILSADFARLADAVAAAEAGGADWIHVDVMDGHFVPNLTIGPPVVAAVRRVTTLPLDVHLMIEEPERLLEAFAGGGADVLTVHREPCPHLHRTVERSRGLGMRPGVAINPATPIESLDEILPYVDLVLVMSVNPGFGGQKYIQTSTRKVARMRQRLEGMGIH